MNFSSRNRPSLLLLLTILVGLSTKFKPSQSYQVFPDESSCLNDDACAYGGRCVSSKTNQTMRYCWCPRSCPQTINAKCTKDKTCNGDKGICNDITGTCICQSRLMDRCAKNDTRVQLQTSKDNPYESHNAKLSCCLNVDSRGLVEDVYWIHNGTLKLRSTKDPDHSVFDRCYELTLNSVRFRDSGNYTCVVRTSWFKEEFRRYVPITVRALPKVNITRIYHYNSTAMRVEWKDEPDVRVDLKLEVAVGAPTDGPRIWHKISDNFLDIGGLLPAVYYNITVQTEKLELGASALASQYTQMPEYIPGPPRLTGMRMKQQKSQCELAWIKPAKPNGKITSYKVSFTGRVRTMPEGVASGIHRPKSNTLECRNLNAVTALEDLVICDFFDLLPNRIYNASVIAVNSAGQSEPANFSTSCVTDYGGPDEIGEIITQAQPDEARGGPENRTFTIIFPKQPDQINGPITCYYLAVVPLPGNLTLDKEKVVMVITKVLKAPKDIPFQAANAPFREKFAYIAESYETLPDMAIVGDGKSKGIPCSDPYMDRDLHNATDKSLTTRFSYTGFLVVRVDSDGAIENGPNRFKRSVFAAIEESEKRFVREAMGQVHYKYSDYFSPVKFLTSDQKTASWYVFTVILSVLLVFLLVATVGLAYFLHRKGWLKHWLCWPTEANDIMDRESFRTINLTNKDFEPISIEDLPNEYILRHRDSDFLFAMEFEALPHFDSVTAASDRPDNARKNRYNDIKAFDLTRVKLKYRNGIPGSDYINANFIQSYKGKNFIAAQGPVTETQGDFWRMIWEHNVESVVMVTNLHEKYRAQCTKYWPDDESCIYGNIEVSAKESNKYADYAVRRFELKCITEENMYDTVPLEDSVSSELNNCIEMSAAEVRRVVQYHYTGWHDYRAPECTTGLLKFLLRLRRMELFGENPVVVHCSAGVGRTGTFIAVDGIMDQCEEVGKADVFGFVSNLRRQRNFMVQSLEQYVFVYKALAEWYTFGDTDMEADKVQEGVSSLRTPLFQNGFLNGNPALNGPSDTGLRLEFAKLDRTLENGRTSEFASKDGNERRNRALGVVPYDRNRVILAPVLGQVDASYINASVVRGYFFPYILAQDPLPHTKWDFWRMISEQTVACVVMLSSSEELETDEQYWPEDSSKGLIFGESPAVSVKLVSEEECPYFISRKMSYCSTKEKESRDVIQYVLRDWPLSSPPAHVPRSSAGLLELIGKVLQRQNNMVDPGPILVHCRDGSTRSGLYCAASLLLERLKAEGRVDVFQTVKGLQAQRAKIIQHVTQYDFCYQIVVDYLESFR